MGSFFEEIVKGGLGEVLGSVLGGGSSKGSSGGGLEDIIKSVQEQMGGGSSSSSSSSSSDNVSGSIPIFFNKVLAPQQSVR